MRCCGQENFVEGEGWDGVMSRGGFVEDSGTGSTVEGAFHKHRWGMEDFIGLG